MTDAWIGIDQSYSGFAMIALQADETYLRFYKRYPEADYGHGIDRLQAMNRDALAWFEFLRDERGLNIWHVVMENYAFGARYRVAQSGELGGSIKGAIRVAFAPPVCYPTLVTPKQLKKFVTHRGDADKATVREWVKKKWGPELAHHDLADAYGMAKIAYYLDTGDDVLTHQEFDVIKSLKRHTEMPKAS